MTRRLLIGIIPFLLSAPAFAQPRDGTQASKLPSTQMVQAYLDIPFADAMVPPDVTFQGWTFNARTGRHVGSIMLWRTDEAKSKTVSVPARVFWGPRPDVQLYAALFGAPMPEEALGFAVVPNEPQPAGAWTYWLLVTDMTRDPDSINWSTSLHRRVIVQ